VETGLIKHSTDAGTLPTRCSSSAQDRAGLAAQCRAQVGPSERDLFEQHFDGQPADVL